MPPPQLGSKTWGSGATKERYAQKSTFQPLCLPAVLFCRPRCAQARRLTAHAWAARNAPGQASAGLPGKSANHAAVEFEFARYSCFRYPLKAESSGRLHSSDCLTILEQSMEFANTTNIAYEVKLLRAVVENHEKTIQTMMATSDNVWVLGRAFTVLTMVSVKRTLADPGSLPLCDVLTSPRPLPALKRTNHFFAAASWVRISNYW